LGNPTYSVNRQHGKTQSRVEKKLEIDTVRFNVPPNTLKVISGTGFYRSSDPTNSVKALKEDMKKEAGVNSVSIDQRSSVTWAWLRKP